MMIEVFKTNVENRFHAKMLTDQIHTHFSGYAANFDLDDCDRILRVKSATGTVQTCQLVELLQRLGFEATVLADDVRRGMSNIPEDTAGHC